MMKSISSLIAGPIGVIVALFFFLPWVTISCAGGFEIEASGMDLARGSALDELEDQAGAMTEGLVSGFEDFENFDDGSSGSIEFDTTNESSLSPTEETALDSDPLVWLILLAALLTAGIAVAHYMFPELKDVAGFIYVILGAIALGVQIFKYFDLQDLKSELEAAQATEGGFIFITMSYSVWWWLTLLGLFAIVVAGLIAILIEDQLVTQPKVATRSPLGNLSPAPDSASSQLDDDDMPSWMNE